MKRIILFLIMVGLCHAQTTGVSRIEGDILHTMQSAWVIAESENSADTQTDALGVKERTYQRVKALIAANANEEVYISITPIPPKWNVMNFRSLAVDDGASSDDNYTVVHQIYLGTRGGLGVNLDCDLSHVAVLTWTTGQQESIYSQVAFTSGGVLVPNRGDIITGNTSGETATVVSISALTSGTWAAGTAAGTITLRSDSGTFQSETVKIQARDGGEDAFTIGADLTRFEYADTVVVTGKDWTKPSREWDINSPADDTTADAKLDVGGADILIVATKTADSDCKLLVKGY